MKGAVVYYSATGNTGKIARAIHRGMKGVLGDADIVSVKHGDPKDMAKYDLIGIGGPIWFFRDTANLRLFIEHMPRLDGKFCFPFCVHGSAPVGYFFAQAPALQRKGLTIIGWNDWYGAVDQVLHMPKPYFTDGHPDAIDLREAEDFGREMAERALKVAAGDKSLIPELPKGKDADSLWRPSDLLPPVSWDVPPRSVNTEKCLYPACTICADNCPMNSIDLAASPPVFRQSCTSCNLCNRICPVDAIELSAAYAQEGRTQKTINMEKCRYPDCTLCIDHCPMNSIDFSVSPPVFRYNCEGDDLCWVICPEGAIEIPNMEKVHGPRSVRDMEHPFLKLLEQAEAAGRFRRLTPMDEIGWDNLICNMKKLPRFVIEEEDVD